MESRDRSRRRGQNRRRPQGNRASREDVFEAWLDSQGMSRWLCPGDVTASEGALEPRVGGRFRTLMQSPQSDHQYIGEFGVLDRPSKLHFTWASA